MTLEFPFVSIVILHSYVDVSLYVTCHLSLHSPQPNISIMDLSDHVSVFLCPSPLCSCFVFDRGPPHPQHAIFALLTFDHVVYISVISLTVKSI